MKNQPQQTITSLPRSPEEERRGRVIRYCIAMGIRLVCVLLLFVVQGWWVWVVAVGALVLPYIAVVLANTVTRDDARPLARPGALSLEPLPRRLDDE